MASAGGDGPDDLTVYDRLCRAPQSFHIFLALRVLEARFAQTPRLGESRRPREDVVRLGAEAELAFPRSTIRDFTPPAPDGTPPGVLTNRFFGLFGPNGPMPTHLTEYVRERAINHRDPTLLAFSNMLSHRMTGLLYRAWAAAQPAPGQDRGEGGRFERKVGALAGYGSPGLRGRDAMPDMTKLHFAAHLGAGPKSADALTAMLGAFFRAPVRLEQFVGSWLALEGNDRWRLGAPTGLGQATSIGARVWSRGAKFRLRIGPLSLAEYRRMLPGGASLARLSAIVRNHVGDALDWDVNLVLRAGEVPQARLGADTRLGQTSWLGRRAEGRGDADDLCLAPQAHFDTTAGHQPAASEGRDLP